MSRSDAASLQHVASPALSLARRPSSEAPTTWFCIVCSMHVVRAHRTLSLSAGCPSGEEFLKVTFLKGAALRRIQRKRAASKKHLLGTPFQKDTLWTIAAQIVTYAHLLSKEKLKTLLRKSIQ